LSKGYEFILSFSSANFKHLTGIQYLDDTIYAKMPANQVFRRILNGEITDDNLRRSRQYEKYCRERIFDLKHMPGILNKNAKGIFPFDKSKAGSSIRSSIILYQEDQRHAFLTLGCKEDMRPGAIGKASPFVPETFFTEVGDRYIKGQERAHVIDVVAVTYDGHHTHGK
jgi:hypothetical protein